MHIGSLFFHERLRVHTWRGDVVMSIYTRSLETLVLSAAFVCLFDLGLTSLSTIFQSYRDGVWM